MQLTTQLTTQIQITPQITIPGIPIIPQIPKLPKPSTQPRPPIIPPFLLPFTEEEGLTREEKQGYQVWVKDRYIVHGKKKYEERFIKIGHPMTRQDAMGYGATIVDESAAASFKIQPTNKPASKPEFPIGNWDLMHDMFYKYNDIFIEQTAHRISTPGEIREISARGWVAERRKLYPKPMKPIKNIRITEKKPARNKQELRNMFRRFDIFWGK